MFKNRIAQRLADWDGMLKSYGTIPGSDTSGITEKDFIF
jgi:hypothetical protein